MLAVQPRSMSMVPRSLAKKAKPTQDQPSPQDRLEQSIEEAQPKICKTVGPAAELIDGKDLTAAENKAAAEKVSAFSEKIRVMSAQVHPFVNYGSMLESWLGASPFRQSSESREIAPLLPGLKFKGVHDVIESEYKVLHSVAAEGWDKSIVPASGPEPGLIDEELRTLPNGKSLAFPLRAFRCLLKRGQQTLDLLIFQAGGGKLNQGAA